MNTHSTETEKYKRAKKKVEDIKGFYANLVSYIVVNPFLIWINLKFSPDHHWFIWPMLGWGIGLFIHGYSVFGKGHLFGREWEERKIKELMRKYDENP